MNDFLKMDVFFVVSTIAVLVVTTLFAFILISVLRILKRVENISETVSEEIGLMRADVADLRNKVRTEGFKIRHMTRFASIFSSLFTGGKKK